MPVNPKPYVAPGTNQPGSGSTQQGAPPQPPNGQPQTPYQQEQPQQPVNPGEDLLSPGASPSYPADIPNFPPHAPELDDLQHCHDGLAYCPFTCHTQCPCYDWCKNAKCPQSQGGIYIDGEGFFDATCVSKTFFISIPPSMAEEGTDMLTNWGRFLRNRTLDRNL